MQNDENFDFEVICGYVELNFLYIVQSPHLRTLHRLDLHVCSPFFMQDWCGCCM